MRPRSKIREAQKKITVPFETQTFALARQRAKPIAILSYRITNLFVVKRKSGINFGTNKVFIFDVLVFIRPASQILAAKRNAVVSHNKALKCFR